MKHRSKLNAKEEQQQAASHETQQAPLEFASAEDMLRHDALHTPVPPAIAQRLQKSLGPGERPVGWWRRFFSS